MAALQSKSLRSSNLTILLALRRCRDPEGAVQQKDPLRQDGKVFRACQPRTRVLPCRLGCIKGKHETQDMKGWRLAGHRRFVILTPQIERRIPGRPSCDFVPRRLPFTNLPPHSSNPTFPFNKLFSVRIMILSRSRATATKASRRDYLNDRGKRGGNKLP